MPRQPIPPLDFNLCLVSGSGVLGECCVLFVNSDQKGFLRIENGLLISRIEVGLITETSVSAKPFKVVNPVNNLGNEVGFLLILSELGDARDPFSAINTCL